MRLEDSVVDFHSFYAEFFGAYLFQLKYLLTSFQHCHFLTSEIMQELLLNVLFADDVRLASERVAKLH